MSIFKGKNILVIGAGSLRKELVRHLLWNEQPGNCSSI